ncbi:hypothetical protein [Noviherbaspirillum cavernae]|nr:hypothetical protein [Noviherbaspirillum cavernae]
MKPLHNAAIERPESLFNVELVMFGSLTRAAAVRTIRVMAQTKDGARKICKAYYRRAEVRNATRATAVSGMTDLFSAVVHP